MSQTSANHPLDLRDTADQPRCPMERLADRMTDAPKPWGCSVNATRMADGAVEYSIRGTFIDPENGIDDLINYLARVKG